MKRKVEYCECPELIENYELAKKDNFKGWDIHHRLETHNSDGARRPVDLKMEELKALNMYYKRPAEELIYMRNSEHYSLHNKGKSHPQTEEVKKRISKTHKGMGHTEETKAKLAELRKGLKCSKSTKTKMSETHKSQMVLIKETYKRLGLKGCWNQFQKAWSNIENNPLWQEGKYDEAVLDAMNLKMTEDGKIVKQ